jgi:hypothetical protein
MKLTYGQIDMMMNNPSTHSLLEKATGVLGLQLYRAVGKLQIEHGFYRKQWQKIITECSQKDTEGNPAIIEQNGIQSVKIKHDKQEQAAAGIKELQDAEVEIDIKPIKIDIEKSPNITAKELLAITYIIED